MIIAHCELLHIAKCDYCTFLIVHYGTLFIIICGWLLQGSVYWLLWGRSCLPVWQSTPHFQIYSVIPFSPIWPTISPIIQWQIKERTEQPYPHTLPYPTSPFLCNDGYLSLTPKHQTVTLTPSHNILLLFLGLMTTKLFCTTILQSFIILQDPYQYVELFHCIMKGLVSVLDGHQFFFSINAQLKRSKFILVLVNTNPFDDCQIWLKGPEQPVAGP